MELRQLEYFVAVAEELHFGRAAERLHIGQPAVSQQLRRLERELGAELFDRSPRHVRLTPAGQALLPQARDVLAAVARARSAVRAASGARNGPLRIGTSSGLGERLEQVLDELLRVAPDLDVELVTIGPTSERLDRVADGSLDAAFVRGTVPDEGRGLRVVPLWRDELVAAVPARHPIAQAEYAAYADLAPLGLRLTTRRNNPALVDLVVGAFHAANHEPTSSQPYTRLADTLAAVGADGTSYTVVYAAHAAQINNRRVAFLPFEPPGLSLMTHLVVRRSAPTPYFSLLMQACDHES
ncbi:MAG: LysR family transcriptional regulator [Catenulispora sp.]|nr:LysR family transcriptional regulator [Catenulispora sp.]